MPTYFGTDGIRGKSPEWLNQTMAYQIGYGLGHGLKIRTLYIGRDTRRTSLDLNQALNQGALDAGVNVINLGVVSTPIIAYLAKKHQVYGVMITASHNPSSDNGIKLIDKGIKSTPFQEDIIESYFNLEAKTSFNPFHEDNALINEYLDNIRKIPFLKTKRKVILDTAHGALYELAPQILKEYAVITDLIGNQPNGLNINDKVGSTHLESLLKAHKHGSVGFAFDGDGDRLIAVDENKEVVTGDQILSIIAKYTKDINKIALTQMVNPGIKKALELKGINVTETKVGDKYILEALDKEELSIGGEDSGHMIFNKVWPTGDGILSALILLDTLEKNNLSLNEAKSPFKPYPQELLNFKKVNASLLEDDTFIKSFKILIDPFIKEGKVLLRKSGTEDLIRLYASHKDEPTLQTFIKEATSLFNSYGGIL